MAQKTNEENKSEEKSTEKVTSWLVREKGRDHG